MTESAGNSPKNRECKFTDSEPIYDTKEEALIMHDTKQSAMKASAADALGDDPVEKNAGAVKEVVVRIGKLHAIYWMLIVVSATIFGFLLAMALFTESGGYQLPLFAVFGNLALAATVFVMSKDNVALVTRKEDSGEVA
jgi:hypothetical protein